MDVRVGLWRRLSAEELMLLNCGVGEDSWESLGLQGDPTSPFQRRSVLGVLWKDWCQSWNSNTLATSCEELTHWKRLWCLEGLGAGEKGTTEDEMAGWHHWLDGREWTPGVGDGQGGLACCNSWGRKESDQTEWLNWHTHRIIWLYKYIQIYMQKMYFLWEGELDGRGHIGRRKVLHWRSFSQVNSRTKRYQQQPTFIGLQYICILKYPLIFERKKIF